MKHKMILFVSLALISQLFAFQNWKTYTNTSHIFDIETFENTTYVATWLGLVEYDIDSNTFGRVFTTNDGLTDIDIRCLSISSDELLIGTQNGISRMKNSKFLTPITEETGLLSNKVNDIIVFDETIFVATNSGISSFQYNDNYPFPLLLNNYSTNEGLIVSNIKKIAIYKDYLFSLSDNYIQWCHKDSLYLQDAWKNYNEDNINFTNIATKDNTFLLSSTNGLYYANSIEQILNHTWINYTITDNLASNNISDVTIDNDNNIWITYGSFNYDTLLFSNDSSIAITKLTIQSNDNLITNWSNEELGSTNIYQIKILNDKLFALSWGDGFFEKSNNDWFNRTMNSIGTGAITGLMIDKNYNLVVYDGIMSGNTSAFGTKGISIFNGESWSLLTPKNSELLSQNYFTGCIDANGNAVVGTWYNTSFDWRVGLNIISTDENNLEITSIQLEGNQANIGDLNLGEDGLLYMGSSGFGVTIFDKEYNMLSTFAVPNTESQFPLEIYQFNNKLFVGLYRYGLRIWEGEGYPENNESTGWSTPNPNELRSGSIFDIAKLKTNNGDELYFATEYGLLKYGSDERWYKYGVGLKIEVYDDQYHTWKEFERYYEDQPRIYGSEYAIPQALFADLYGRLWIGTAKNGICIYDPNADDYHNEFTVIQKPNYPLLSNEINSFAYNELTGELFIGTSLGINSVEIGKAIKTETKLRNIIAYPNPFNPNKSNFKLINTPSGTMPKGSNYCNIYDVNGELIIKLQEDKFFQFTWDGKNENGKDCSSGIYFWVISTGIGESQKGTIVLIR